MHKSLWLMYARRNSSKSNYFLNPIVKSFACPRRKKCALVLTRGACSSTGGWLIPVIAHRERIERIKSISLRFERRVTFSWCSERARLITAPRQLLSLWRAKRPVRATLHIAAIERSFSWSRVMRSQVITCTGNARAPPKHFFSHKQLCAQEDLNHI